ncbi:phage holin family protein [Lysinibacillus capsici]|uniref:phage holin family protein n=1 Tax=Lysinibacillus capsici TaxID=2115968 RepID=UPI003D80EEAA
MEGFYYAKRKVSNEDRHSIPLTSRCTIAWLGYLVGGVDYLIKALVILMFIDYALGYMVSLVFKKKESKKFEGCL